MTAPAAASVEDAGAPPGCALEVRVATRDGAAVPGAEVALVEAGERAISDERGRVCLDPAPGSADTLVVTADGFAVATSRIRTSRAPAALAVELTPAFGEELVVSATRTAKRLLDVPVHIQQIGRESIEASAARTLAEAVEYTPGLRVESNCQNCNTAQLRMLGLEGPYSQILVEGQPTVSSLAMVYGLEQIPARLLDAIEIVKGGGSATYGASAVGGTVNLLPHQPDHTHVELDARATGTGGESGSSVNALADWSGAQRRLAATVYVQADEVPAIDVDGDAYSEVTERDLLAGGARFEALMLSDRARFSGDLNVIDAERRGGDLARFHLPPDQTALTEEIFTETLAASVRFLHSVRPRFDYRLALSRSENDRESYYGAGFDPNAYGTTANPTTVLDAQASHYLASTTVTWGLQAQRDEIEDVQLGYGRVIEARYDDVGVFAQDDRSLGKGFTLLWGARLDDHSALDDPVFSPRSALLWAPRADLTLRASVSTGFRPPATFDEDLHIELIGGGRARVVFNSPDLEEEQSISYLTSAEWRPTFGRKGSAAFEAALFRTRLTDLFFDRENDDPATPELELLKVNLGGATVEGLEVSGSVRWGSLVVVDGGVVFQSARFDDPEPDFGSRDFFRTPETYGNLSAQWSLPWRLDLFVGALYTGPMTAAHYAGFVPEDRLERTPSFLTFDLNLGKTFPLGGERELSLTVGGRNLTDEFQRDLDQGPDRDANYVYGPRFPRSWFVGLGLTL